MATKRRPKKAPTEQQPSETYAARVARGRPIVSLSLPAELVADLKTQARLTDRTMSAVVEDALVLLLHKLHTDDPSKVIVEQIPAVGGSADPKIAADTARDRAERPVLAAHSAAVSSQVTREEYELLKKHGAKKKSRSNP